MALSFFELVARIIQLDLTWFIGLFFNNLFWVFAFATVAYFTISKKRLVFGTIFIFVTLTITTTFPSYVGWTVLSGAFLSTHYIVKLVLVSFTENVEALQKHFLIINVMQFVVTLAIFNLVVTLL